MVTGQIPEFVRRRLTADETLLWKHIPSDEIYMQYADKNKQWPLWLRSIWMIVFIGLLIGPYLRNPEIFAAELKRMLPTFLVFFGASWIFFHSPISAKLKELMQPYDIFSGLILTNENAIVFNSPSDAMTLPRNKITVFKTDFENGGPSLSIKSSRQKKRIVVVGNADFSAAENLFHKNI